MAQDMQPKFRLYQDTYNTDGYTDENSLANALLTEADTLSPVITHLAGREDKRFPLTFMTEGMGNTKYINDTQYDYPVIGRLNKAIDAVKLVRGTGVNHSRFEVAFKEKWFNKNYIIESPYGIQARIMEEPYEGTYGYHYVLQLVTANASDSISATDIEGLKFIQMFAPNAMSGSRGTDSNWVAPSKARNQISLIRKSYRYEGNVQNKVAVFEFNVGGRTTKLWTDFEEYQFMLRWKEECEQALWYSQYNRDRNGLIHLKDENGQTIPLGSGVLEQIPNFETYTELTSSRLKDIVRDVMFGATDAQQMNIVLYTGLGGMEEFDKGMKQEIANGSYIKNTPDTAFMRGGTASMEFGGFFTSYRHIDGHVITVRHLPLFDHGSRALNSPKHPVTGLPLESYRMIFLDQSTYDGQSNVSMVTRKGREMVRWAVAGASIPKGFSGNALRATDKDGSSVHFMKELGINIRRATNCLHLSSAYLGF